MPWATLPHTITVGGFRFVPIEANDPAPAVGSDIAAAISRVLELYVDRGGEPIRSCTIVLRSRHPEAWNIPDQQWGQARRAAEILSLSCLAEQRFMERLSPHLNATMFQIIGQGIKANSDQITLFFPRRGSGLRIGGIRFKDVVFQRPPQVEGTKCEVIGTRLAKALDKARRTKNPVWKPIGSSLELFLLGHAETPELDWDSCTMLSAMAFERLLEPKERRAQVLAESFANLWAPFTSRPMETAKKRVKPDPKWVSDQRTWPIHRKWMKELYEARSSMAHSGPRSDFSQNWEGWQHMVVAAFVYPLAVKLKLADAGLYQLNDWEQGACDALDELLASDWGKGWQKPPEWSRILSMSEGSRVLDRNVEEAYQEATELGPRGRRRARIGGANQRRRYD